MATKTALRVKESTTTTGTGDITLGGAATGFREFPQAFGDGDIIPYVLEDADGSSWEAGHGTLTATSPATFERTTVYASTNNGAAINLSAGTHTIFACEFLDDEGAMKGDGAGGFDKFVAESTVTTSLPYSGARRSVAVAETGLNHSSAVTYLTEATFDTSDFDTDSWWSDADDGFVVPAGVTKIRAGFTLLTANNTGTDFYAVVANTTTGENIAGSRGDNSSSNTTSRNGAGILDVAEGDVIQCGFFCNDASVDVSVGSSFWIEAIEGSILDITTDGVSVVESSASATYTLSSSDNGKFLVLSGGTVEIPTGLPTDFEVTIMDDTGSLTINDDGTSPSATVQARGLSAPISSAGDHAVIGIKHIGSDRFVVFGDIA